MLDLASVTSATFEPCLQQPFEILNSTPPVSLTLKEIRLLGEHAANLRVPFGLTFQGVPNLRLPQGMYALKNAQLGELHLFLVQSGANETSSSIEATFN